MDSIRQEQPSLEVTKDILNQIKQGAIMLRFSGDRYECVFFNNYLAEALGYTAKEFRTLVDHSIMDFFYPADHANLSNSLEEAKRGEKTSFTGRLIQKDGDTNWVLGHYQEFSVEDSIYITMIMTNISELITAQQKMEEDNNKWADIVNSVPIGLGIFNIKDGKTNTIAINTPLVMFANSIGTALDGKARKWSREEMEILLNQTIYAFCVNEDQHLVKKMLDDSADQMVSECRFRLRGSDENNAIYVYSTCHSKPVEDGSRNYYVTFQDVTKETKQEEEIGKQQEELIKLSYYDSLTKVKNRNAYKAYLERLKSEPVSNVGIAFADINGLKKVNDSLGHMYGDEMLLRFVGILGKQFLLGNIYRISGDEFVIIQPNIEKEDFQRRMRDVLDAIAAERNIASVGYLWNEKPGGMRQAVGQAEQLMHVEKQNYYELTKTISSKHRPEILNALLSDLENNRFQMYLQPKSRIQEHRAIGAEALVRKFNEKGKVVPPIEFVPMLERERLIPKIDLFMLEEVCKFLQQLKAEGNTEFKVSTNMSRVTLVENDYINLVREILDRYDFNRSQLEFEITESNETMDNNRLEDYMKQIKDLGISISLDDVGTDYSSLTMLILSGVDVVKVDRSLVIQLGNEKADKLLTHVINMSHDLGLTVIAEGVEDDEVREQLDRMNCDMYQGYLMSKPIPVAEFREKFM